MIIEKNVMYLFHKQRILNSERELNIYISKIECLTRSLRVDTLLVYINIKTSEEFNHLGSATRQDAKGV